MSDRWIALILFVVLAVLAPAHAIAADKPQPRAVQGILDLTNWDFERDGIVQLNGEYEFYWQRFLNRRELLTELPEYFAEVPRPWNGVHAGPDIVSGQGHATYRLNILVPPEPPNLSLKVLDFGTSARIFIDGELVTQVGHPGTEARGTDGAYKPQIIDFTSEGQRIELVLHVANFEHRLGGIWEPLLLGSTDDVHRFADNKVAKELLLCGALLMMALFNMAFFILRRDRHANLFLALFCLSAGLRIISADEHYLLRIFPDLSWQVSAKLEYASWYLLLPLFAHFLQSLYPREVDKRVLYLLDGVSLFAFAIVMVTSLGIYSYTSPFMQIVNLLAMLYGAYALLLARRHRREGANILLFGFLFLFACAINDILGASFIINTPSLVDIGVVGFVICQSILASYDFAVSVSTVEKQYEQLATSSLKLQTQEKLRMEAEMQSRKVTARFRESQQFEALGILAHGVVSDLKNSFDQAAEETEKLRVHLQSNPELLASLNKTKQVADRSVAVIEDLLSLSTFDSESQATDLNKTIETYLATPKVKQNFLKHKITVDQHLTGSIQAVVGSKLHIQRILENLLTNSVDCQPEGGRTLVSSEQIYTDGRTLFYDTIDPGYYVILSVEDSGQGIHPEDLDSIFQPFFSRQEESKQSMGLGMSVVRAIVKQLNGGIDVISELGQGTRFDIYLPVVLPAR